MFSFEQYLQAVYLGSIEGMRMDFLETISK